MADRQMFNFIANKYTLGNFDTPGIFATSGRYNYYRNYERFITVQSFKSISSQFVEGIANGSKKPLSSRHILDFFPVNLRNTEYFYYFPLKAFIVLQGFLASILLVILAFDTLVKPVMGLSPTHPRFRVSKHDKA